MNNNKAIPFILYDKQRGYYVTEKAEKFLINLQSESLGVVSVVGKYRTGKSYLINKVILNTLKGFEVGSTIKACTKGIWLWGDTLKKNSMDILVMDTEGFGGIGEAQNHDTRIFLFSLLLSSLFVYNSVGTINESSLENLHLVIKLAEELHKKNKEFCKFPYFLWIVRDFALKLQNNKKEDISCD